MAESKIMKTDRHAAWWIDKNLKCCWRDRCKREAICLIDGEDQLIPMCEYHYKKECNNIIPRVVGFDSIFDLDRS